MDPLSGLLLLLLRRSLPDRLGLLQVPAIVLRPVDGVLQLLRSQGLLLGAAVFLGVRGVLGRPAGARKDVGIANLLGAAALQIAVLMQAGSLGRIDKKAGAALVVGQGSLFLQEVELETSPDITVQTLPATIKKNTTIRDYRQVLPHTETARTTALGI